MKSPECETAEYISAEFKLKNPGIFFLFKLRRHNDEPLCAVVRKSSKALEALKEGNLVPMTYHFQDRTIPAQQCSTRIKTILEGADIGFKDHFLISLEITNKEEK